MSTDTNFGGIRRRFDIEKDTESSDDEVRPIKNQVCGGADSRNGVCCSSVSPIKTVVDIEDILVRKSINNDTETNR